MTQQIIEVVEARPALGDITFIEMPEPGKTVADGEELCAIESCKAAASIYAPVGGQVTEVNAALEDDPGAVNADCYGQGWICRLRVKDPADADSLMDAAAYEGFCKTQQD